MKYIMLGFLFAGCFGVSKEDAPGQLPGPYPRIVKNGLGQYAVFTGQREWLSHDDKTWYWEDYYLFKRFAHSAYSWQPQDKIFTSVSLYDADWAISNGDSIRQVICKDSAEAARFMDQYLTELKADSLHQDSLKKSITFH